MPTPKVYNNPEVFIDVVHLPARVTDESYLPLCWDGMLHAGMWRWNRKLEVVTCASCLAIIEYEKKQHEGVVTLVHKLIQPIPKAPLPGMHIFLHDLVLCWHSTGYPDPETVDRTAVDTSINNVNCEECLILWGSGIYG